MYKGEVMALEESELDNVIEAAADHTERVEYTIRTLARTGMRVSEFTHMTEAWLDPKSDPPRIRVPTHEPCDCTDCMQKAEQSTELDESDYWKPKSASGARTIPVAHDKAWRTLESFLEKNGQVQVGRGAVWSRVKKVEAAVDLPEPLTPHIFRHTYGTQSVSRGMDITRLKDVLGHSDISNTQVYVTLSGDVVADAVADAWGDA